MMNTTEKQERRWNQQRRHCFAKFCAPAALKRWPLSIECKNQERVNLWASWEQANDNTIEGTIPVLVIKKNREKPVVVVDAETFFHMVAEVNTETSTPVV
ncbi:MAG: hypothetical protein EB156_05175 [Euryarchaeota archaeon]|nr:hypothetical protein [Euryarchaeota archaeon]